VPVSKSTSRTIASPGSKITEDGVRHPAEMYYQQLLAESRKYNATKLLRQIPSIGPIRAALLLASRDTSPLQHQAPTLGLRALGVEDESSAGEYRFAEGPDQTLQETSRRPRAQPES